MASLGVLYTPPSTILAADTVPEDCVITAAQLTRAKSMAFLNDHLRKVLWVLAGSAGTWISVTISLAARELICSPLMTKKLAAVQVWAVVTMLAPSATRAVAVSEGQTAMQPPSGPKME